MTLTPRHTKPRRETPRRLARLTAERTRVALMRALWVDDAPNGRHPFA